MRNNYMFTCDKETDVYESEIRKFDKVLDNIVKAIRSEWNKFYK